MRKLTLPICWVLMGIMVGVIAIAMSPQRVFLPIRGDARNLFWPLGVLGAVLVTLAVITKMPRLLRIFMVVVGASAIGWPVSVYVHDLLYPLFPTEPVTYIMVFYVLPLTFIIGVVGSIVAAVIKKGK